MTIRPSRRRHAGFTLIEVLLVLVILVALVSLVVGNYIAQQRKAQVQTARSQIGLFETPLATYHLDMNMYPATEQGLQALLQPPADVPDPAKWNGPYLEKQLPLDPWGGAYQYQSPGTHNSNSYDIWTVAPDGSEIGNWSE